MISPPKTARPLRLSDNLFRSLLLAYPRAFRDAYGPEMAGVFRDCCREVYRGDGWRGLLRLWLPTLGDLAVTAVRERLLSGERRETWARWGGLAAMLGGAGWLLKGGTNVLGGPTWLEWGFAGLFLFPIGLLGLRARLGRQGGELVAAGGALAWAAAGLLLVAAIAGVVLPGGFTSEPPVPIRIGWVAASLSLQASLVLLGLACLRAQALPHPWGAVPLAMGVLGPPLVGLGGLVLGGLGQGVRELPIVLFGLGWLLLGYLLWSGPSGHFRGSRPAA